MACMGQRYPTCGNGAAPMQNALRSRQPDQLLDQPLIRAAQQLDRGVLTGGDHAHDPQRKVERALLGLHRVVIRRVIQGAAQGAASAWASLSATSCPAAIR